MTLDVIYGLRWCCDLAASYPHTICAAQTWPWLNAPHSKHMLVTDQCLQCSFHSVAEVAESFKSVRL